MVDASVVVDALAGAQRGAVARAAIQELREIPAPALLPAEVTASLRSLVLRRRLTERLARWALRELAELPVQLYPFLVFRDRIWELRDSLTPYDAWYVALAEALEVPLLTADRRLARAGGPRCEVQVIV